MRFILKVSGIFLLSLILIFTLVACGGKNKEQGGEENKGNSSLNENNSSVITGATDNGDGLNINDIFGDDSSSQTETSSDSSSSSVSDSGSSSNSSSGINYNDPSIWTDPV